MSSLLVAKIQDYPWWPAVEVNAPQERKGLDYAFPADKFM
jgi:hypothetical protein